MIEPLDETDPVALTVEIKPDPADAGGWLRLALLAAEDWDLVGEAFAIVDHEGAELARGTFAPDDFGVVRGGPLNLPAPGEPGSYTWRVVIGEGGSAGAEDDGAGDELLAVDFTVDVGAHTISVSVWDVPPAVEKGQAFRVHLGLRCTSDCASRHWPFAIRDQAGQLVASGAVGDTPWQGTSGLHYAEVDLVAPAEEGRFAWTVSAPPPEGHHPHREGQLVFQFVVAPAAEHTLTVQAVDAVTGAPVGRLKVVAHPYRTITDEQGIASLRVPGGTHTIFVSGKQYFPFRTTEEVNGDLTIRAELHVDREYSVADAWA